MRAFYQIRALLERGWQIDVVAPSYPDQAARGGELATLGARLRLVRRPDAKRAEVAKALLLHPSLMLRMPAWLQWQAEVFWTHIARATAEEARHADAVIVEHDFAAAWASHLNPRLPCGLIFHNVTSQYWLGQATLNAGTTHARVARLQAHLSEAHIRRHVGRYGWVCAMSQEDARQIAALGGPTAAIIPNGANVQALAHVPTGGAADGPILFAGTLSYPPNADAVRWMALEVMPLVRRTVPSARLQIVGRGASTALRAIDGVEFVGWVDDIAAVYAKAAVAVAPVRSGSGTNLKVIEALAAGVPLTATTMAARGLNIAPGRDLLIADDAPTFADAVVRLLRDRVLALRLASAGRDSARAYSWDSLGELTHRELTQWLNASG